MFGNLLPIIITLTGAYFFVRLRAFFIIHPIKTAKCAISALGEKENFRAFMLALAGTLGVGNVFGVSFGIIVGGAGSVFWLLLSSLFSATLKYAEVSLSAGEEIKEHGGIFFVIKSAHRKFGKVLSFIYAASCILLSLFMGSALQSNTVFSSSGEIFDTPPTFIPIIFAILIFLSVLFGGKIIRKLTAIVIPLTTIIYIIIMLAVIIINIGQIPDILFKIITEAFKPSAAVGGIFGFLFSSAVREGYSRGILSNEAGAGTSTIAHMTATDMVPAARGVLGIFEVFFDTTLLCTLTALAILTAVPNTGDFGGGMSLVLHAIGGTLGTPFTYILSFLVFAFAYSTILSWYYYGTECIYQIFGKYMNFVFLPMFILSIIVGAYLPESMLVFFSDTLLFILTIITVPTLIKKADRIVALSADLKIK